jgi:hypothetical protein
VTLLVLTAECGGAGQQLVGDRDGRTPAEAGIERAQQRVLAPRGGGEVGCAVDDSTVGDEHSPTVGAGTDISAALCGQQRGRTKQLLEAR